MSEKSDEIVLRLYRARVARDLAKERFRDVCEEAGPCERLDDDTEGRPCYYADPPIIGTEAACGSCNARAPVWRERQAAGREVGLALKQLMRYGSKLEFVEECD